MKIVLYLHMHQPWRLARFRYLDLGSGRSYFDVDRNLSIFRGIADRCYLPTLDRLLRARDERSEFRLSLSITGTFLEQARLAAPEVLDRVRELYRTGRVALLAETYYHSLAFLLPPPELHEEVELHRAMLQKRVRGEPEGPSHDGARVLRRPRPVRGAGTLPRHAGGRMGGGPPWGAPTYAVLRRARPDR